MFEPDDPPEAKGGPGPGHPEPTEPGFEDLAEDDDSPDLRRNLRALQRIADFHRQIGSVDQPPAGQNPLGAGSHGTRPEAPGHHRKDADPPEGGGPSTWGRLEIRRKLGQGAEGEVFLAHDPDLSRDIALKLYRRDSAASRGDYGHRNTILREGQLMAKVRHPNVITVHGAEVHDHRVGIRMDFIHGETLGQILQRRIRMGAEEATLIGLDLCRALAAVHARKLVHQDVKPQNIMREDGGRIVLMDFGVGVDRSSPLMPLIAAGSPLYQAPEALLAGQVSSAGDIYSLGVVLFQLVTGTRPVEAEDLGSLLAHHQHGRRALLRDIRADLPKAFVDVVEKALAIDPADRYRTMGEMEAALAAAGGRPIVVKQAAPPRWLVFALAGIAVAIGSLAVWQVYSSRRGARPVRDAAYSESAKAAVEVAKAQQELGSFYLRMGRCPEAAFEYRKALSELRSVLGDQDSLVAAAMYNVGRTYAVRDRLTPAQSDSAVSMLLACSEIQAKRLGKDAPDRARTLKELAAVYEKSGDTAKAETCLKQVVALRSEGSDPATPAESRKAERERPDSSIPNPEPDRNPEPVPVGALISSIPSAQNPASDRRPKAGGSPGRSPAGATESDRYSYAASFSRYSPDTRSIEDSLAAGETVTLGNSLFMCFQGTIPLYVYVLTRDKSGHEYVLFPVPGGEWSNPLPSDTRVELPGRIGGKRQSWGVTSRGGEERFLIITSPSPVREIEDQALFMRKPSADQPATEVPLSTAAAIRLRGVGGLSEIPAEGIIGSDAATQGAVEAYLAAARVLSASGEYASGVAFRKFWLRNP